MKGSDIQDILSTLIFIAAIIGTFWFMRTSFISYRGGIETPMENFESLQAAYAVESCLVTLSGEGYITSRILDEKDGEFVGEDDFCNIIHPPIHAEITDLDTGKEWEFDRPTGADLERFFDKTRDWAWDIITFWKSRRGERQPEHTIFVPILYNDVTSVGETDTVMEAWKRYVVRYSKSRGRGVEGDNVRLDIYPIERYTEDASVLEVVEIKTMEEFEGFKKEIEGLPEGSEKTVVLINHVRRFMEAGEIRGSYKLASSPEECGETSGKKMCIHLYVREIHGGKLYVKI